MGLSTTASGLPAGLRSRHADAPDVLAFYAPQYCIPYPGAAAAPYPMTAPPPPPGWGAQGVAPAAPAAPAQ